MPLRGLNGLGSSWTGGDGRDETAAEGGDTEGGDRRNVSRQERPWLNAVCLIIRVLLDEKYPG